MGGGSILIIHDAGAGDFIAQSAAIREIRRLYPEAHITLIVYTHAINLAETCPYVDELLVNNRPFVPTLFNDFQWNISFARQLLKRRFDICFSLALYTGTPFLMYMSGARIRITRSIESEKDEQGFGFSEVPLRYSINLATHFSSRFAYGNHMVDTNLSLVESLLHLPVLNRKPEIWYTPFDVYVAKSFLEDVSHPIYSLNMGGSAFKKHYPPEKYAQLLGMILREEPTATFIILGGGQFDLKSAEIIKNVAPQIYENHIIDLTNKINYRQTAVVLKFCDMHIGNDTGTVHVATTVNCPVLTINCFSADLPILSTNIPQIWYPYGVPSVIVQPKQSLLECRNSDDIFGCAANFPHCITQINPETLFKEFHLLKERVAKKINEPLYIH